MVPVSYFLTIAPILTMKRTSIFADRTTKSHQELVALLAERDGHAMTIQYLALRPSTVRWTAQKRVDAIAKSRIALLRQIFANPKQCTPHPRFIHLVKDFSKVSAIQHSRHDAEPQFCLLYFKQATSKQLRSAPNS